MKRLLLLSLALFLLVSCGSAGEEKQKTAARPEVSPAVDYEGCDTAFIFDPSQPPDPVLNAMQEADLVPIETRFDLGGSGGGVGSPGHPGTVEGVEQALDMASEEFGGDPSIIGIRVSGEIDTAALGDLAESVHTRVLVPSMAAVALAPPGIGDGEPVSVVGSDSC